MPALTPLRIEGSIRHPADGEPWEYTVVVSIRNDRGEETARKLIGVGAMNPNEQRTFTLSVEAVSAKANAPAEAARGTERSKSMPAIYRSPLPGRNYRSLDTLLAAVRNCRACEQHLPLGARPVLRAHAAARILIVGQAPGLRVHTTGIPWDDASGQRLREWMGVNRDTFYDETRIAIIPMGYCYPGRGTDGDMAPRRECAELWLDRLLAKLPRIELTLLIGQYAQRHFLSNHRKRSLAETTGTGRTTLRNTFRCPTRHRAIHRGSSAIPGSRSSFYQCCKRGLKRLSRAEGTLEFS